MKSLSLFLFAVAFLCCTTLNSIAQKNSGNVLEKGTDEYKMFIAKQDYFSGDYRSAVNKYKEVLKNRATDASLQFYIGQCYFMMREYNAALEYLEAANNINPSTNEELSLVLGRTYHYKGQLDKALYQLEKYRKSITDSPKKLEDAEIDIYISQCKLAKQLMEKPVNASLIPLLEINSQYDDKGPVLTNDDKTILFTSRRPTGDKSKMDSEGDYGYYDDVYESNWSDEKKTWLQADMMRGPINSEGYDACNSISSDGMFMFIYRNDPSTARGGEIFMSKKASSGKWKAPEILAKPINTSYYEDAACLSPDGKTLYFVSERPGGLGRGDIWVSTRLGGGWGDPVNLGAPINTPYDENGLYLTPDGKNLFFCSNGTTSMGSYDIFRTSKGFDGKWSVPINLGYPINSVGMESKFVTTVDHKTAYISTVRDSGLGERDIMRIDLSNYNVFTGENTFLPAKASFNGKILTPDGIGIVAAQIRVVNKETNLEIAITTTSADGSFSVEIMGDINCKIDIAAEGYQPFSEDLIIPPGKKQSKNITLLKNN
jgi:tetratricopeptide (TPR) repeat protein